MEDLRFIGLHADCRLCRHNHWFKQAKKYLAWEGSLADSGGTVGDESANPGPALPCSAELQSQQGAWVVIDDRS